MKNERLIALMKLRGFNMASLSAASKIPESTLSRIIGGKVKHVKMTQMESIARALNTGIFTIFDLPVEQSVSTAIRPDEAGSPVTKLLSPDESFLLYWYQNSSNDGRTAIFEKAKSEYGKTIRELQERAIMASIPVKPDTDYEQIELDLRLTEPDTLIN